MLGWSIVSAVAAVVIFGGASWETPWRRLLEPFLVSMVYTICIVPLAAFTMPRVMPKVRGRVAFPFDWAILIPVMVAIGITGSFAAIFLLWTFGYIEPGQVSRWLVGSFKQAVVMTLIFGISISAVEALRARLDDATMALRTKERDEAEARRVAAEAQLASLESRVNPHFLFNTLNSIATLVHDDPSAAERMTTQLAALLRSSLDSGAVLVPLADELKLVRAYLDIERVRFGDRLRYDVRTQGDTSAARVPRLAVQTLVENSVKYAVSPSRDGASIAVHVAAGDGHLLIEVTDDGPGFDVSTVPAGHGLSLVRERLAMTFGDRASFAIDSQPGRTAATIDVPSN
jgi:signal transduction histidine kinase